MTSSAHDKGSVAPGVTRRSGAQTGARQFVETRWTIVLAAGRSDTPQAQDALGKLCQTYWYPLLIGMTALRFRIGLLWLVTGLSAASYMGLVLEASLHRPQFAVRFKD